MLRFTKMILMLSAYKSKQDFCQNLSKVQIFLHYIIHAFRLFPASSHPIIARFSNFVRLILVAPATNVISEPFPWLLPNRSPKSRQYLQISFFFRKVSLFSKIVYWNPAKMSFRETLTLIIVNIIIIAIIYLVTVYKNGFT